MDYLMMFTWEIFITIEILSVVFLLTFLVIRYAFSKYKLSHIFLFLFILCIFLEASLAFILYKETGEIDTIQIVIAIFVLYAVTFGISDFKKLDRYMKQKIGKWRGINLLTEKEQLMIERGKDPKIIAKKSRLWWYTHTIIFVVGHYIFWVYYGNDQLPITDYIVDWSWFGEEGVENNPFKNEMIANISRLWIVIYAVDTIVSWSYTFFPGKKKD